MLKAYKAGQWTCLIIVKLYCCGYGTPADTRRTVAINCHRCFDTLFAERCMSTWHESNVFACCSRLCLSVKTSAKCSAGSSAARWRQFSTNCKRCISSDWSSCECASMRHIPYSTFLYLHFPTLLTCTLIFHTCVFHPRVAVLQYSVLVFSAPTHFATFYFTFP